MYYYNCLNGLLEVEEFKFLMFIYFFFYVNLKKVFVVIFYLGIIEKILIFIFVFIIYSLY